MVEIDEGCLTQLRNNEKVLFDVLPDHHILFTRMDKNLMVITFNGNKQNRPSGPNNLKIKAF